MTTILELASILAADIEDLTEMWFPCDDQGDLNLSKRINLQQIFRSGLVHVGTGTPEGFVAANPGSLYYRTDGSDGTTLYVKVTGTTVTGWVAFDKGADPGGITVDDTMSDSSPNPVQNQVIKSYVDMHTAIGPDDQVVIGSGNSSTDTTNLDAAVTALNAAGTGTLWIGGEVIIDHELAFSAPISIRGLGGYGSFKVTNVAAAFNYGANFDPYSSGAVAGSAVGTSITATVAFQNNVHSTLLELNNGDWFMVWSEDDISGAEWNWSGGQRPMEMHQVFRREEATFTANVSTDQLTLSNAQVRNDYPFRVETTGILPSLSGTPMSPSTTYYARDFTKIGSGAGETSTIKIALTPGGAAQNITDVGIGTHTLKSHVYAIGDFIPDALTTSPKIRRLPILSQPDAENTSNVKICDLSIRQEAGIHDNVLFKLQLLNGLEIGNLHYELDSGSGGPGQILIGQCANVRIHHIVCDGVEDYDGSNESTYFLEMQAVNSVVISDCIFKRTRHAVDTTNQSQTGVATTGVRYGTARNVRIHGNIFYGEGRHSSLPPLSTHGEGWGIVAENNTFYISDANNVLNNYVAQIRSRHFKFRNNTIYGSSANKGLLVDADDVVVEGNFFFKTWRCAEFSSSLAAAAPYDRSVFRNNYCQDCIGDKIVEFKAGNNHVCDGNTFVNFEQRCVEIRTGDGHQVVGNKFYNMTSSAFNLPCLSFTSTGGSSVTNVLIADNIFRDVKEDCIYFFGSGNGQQIIGNKFINSGTSNSLIRFTGASTGHRVALNDMAKGPNVFSINLGSLAAASIRIRGNNLDQYGDSSMGMTGTNVIEIQTDELGYNTTD